MKKVVRKREGEGSIYMNGSVIRKTHKKKKYKGEEMKKGEKKRRGRSKNHKGKETTEVKKNGQ